MKRWQYSLVAVTLLGIGAQAACGADAPMAGRASVPNMRPGDHSFSFRGGELERCYSVHVPPGYDGALLMPVVVMLHGGGGTGRAAATETGWGTKADQARFLAVFPEVLARDPGKPSSFAGNPQLWNDGSERFYITVEELGHTWAGGKSLLPEFMVGKRSDKIKPTDVIWDFFQKHRAPSQSKKQQ